MKTVMCLGTFDILHLGHLHYLEQAKKYGDYLIVVIARDETKKKQKKKTIFNEQERRDLVEQLRIVDEAVLGYPENHLKVILEKRPDVICLGYDHSISEKELKQKLLVLGLNTQVVRAKPFHPEKNKSGKIKQFILEKI